MLYICEINIDKNYDKPDQGKYHYACLSSQKLHLDMVLNHVDIYIRCQQKYGFSTFFVLREGHLLCVVLPSHPLPKKDVQKDLIACRGLLVP